MEYASGEINIWKDKKFLLVVAIGFVLRLLFNAIVINLNHEWYWEFGELAKNLLHGNGYSFFYFENGGLEILYKPGVHAFPSAYMPPGYSFFLIPFLLIKNLVLRNYLILLCHTVSWAFTEYYLFKLVRKLFNYRIALWSIAIYAVVPEFIYANSTWGTAQFYHLFVAVILNLFYDFDEKPDLKNAVKIGVIFGVSFLFRSEQIILLFLFSLYQLYKKRFKVLIIINFIVLACMVPWMVRNYITFNHLVTGSTSAGYNFFRGHNPYYPGILAASYADSLIYKLPQNDHFEIEMNDLYFKLAFKSIKENPAKEALNTGIKFFDLWVAFWRPPRHDSKEFNSGGDSRSLNPGYIVPWFIMLGLFIFYVKNHYDKKRDRYFLMFVLYHTFLALIFFAIARYQTMMKIALLPYAAGGAIILWDRWKNKFGKKK